MLDRSIILDSTHNPEGALHLERNLQEFVRERGYKPVILTGTLGLPRARALIPVVCRYASEIHLLQPHQPRACTFEELASEIPSDFPGKVWKSSVKEIFPAPGVCTIGNAGTDLVATGSIYLIGEIMEALYHDVPVGEQILQD